MSKRPSLAGSMKALREDTRPNVEALTAPEEDQKRPDAKHEKKARNEPAARYSGLKTVLIGIDPQLHRELKVRAAREDMTIVKLIEAACTEYLKNNP